MSNAPGEATPPTNSDDRLNEFMPKPITAGRVLKWTVASGLVLALLASILLPSLGRARETANRVKCASNLKQIGQAILLYANENGGQMPPGWPTLLVTQDLVPEMFICPSHEREKATGTTAQAMAAALLEGDHIAYVCVGGERYADLTADTVVAFDLDDHLPKDSAKGKGINVLLGNGAVEFVDEMTARAIRACHLAGVRPILLSECSPKQ